MGKSRGAFAAAAAALFLFSSCPNPIDQRNVDSARDGTPPTIAVSSPAEYASYARTIVIEGTVSDQAGDGAAGKVASLSYEIVSHTAAKAASFSASGAFTIEEPNDLKENIVVLLKAVDWNGNESELRLPLTYPGNEIPSFASIEGNRQTELSWDPVPDVVSYRLYLEPSARTPDPAQSTYIDAVSSPYVLKQLKNGTMYSLLLEGTTADGRKNYSEVVRAIPLSAMHLLPSAASYFNGIELSWRTFSSISAYEVLRAESPDGPWQSVSGPVSAPPYRDSSVSRGGSYYYAVKPSAYSAVRSEWIEARADPAASRSDSSVSSYEDLEMAESSVWRDGYLYVADYRYGLRVVDMRDPSFPREAGKTSISSARDVFLQGNYAYVTGWKSLYIVDVSTPSAPTVVGSVVVSAGDGFQAEGVSVLGDLAYVAGFNEGFAVVDVTVKSAPVVRLSDQDAAVFVQNYETAVQDRGGTILLAVAGNSAGALYQVGGSASAPTLTALSTALSGGSAWAFSGTTLFGASGWNVVAWDTSTPASPALLDSVDASGTVEPAESVSVYGTRVFAALRDYGYAVVDAADPANLSVIRIQTVPGSVGHVEAAGGYAFVSAGEGYALQVYGADDPSAATLAATLADVGTGARIAAYRDRLYISESGSGDWTAAVYDISDPVNASRASGSAGSYTPYSFAFAGEKIYLAAERSGVMQWNASDPSAPQVVYPWYVGVPGGYAWAIALSGHYAFLGTSGSTFVSVDLSRPDALTVVASLQTQGTVSSSYEIRGLAVRGDLAYAANEDGGLRAVDVSDPAFPIALPGYGALPAGGSAEAAAAAGSYVLVADSVNGLLVYDGAARNWSSAGTAPVWPAAPSGVGATDVAVRGNYAYVAKPSAGLEIWDISNPREPTAAGTLAAAGFAPMKIVVYGDYLYAIDGGSKLYVVDLVP